MGKTKDGPTSSTTQPAKTAVATSSGADKPKVKRSANGFFANLFRTDLYKPVQGKKMRLATGLVLGVFVAAGVWQLSQSLDQYGPPIRLGLPALIGVVLVWTIFRILHYPRFAEFLIATEAEVNKVSWINRADLIRATQVVMVTVVVLSLYLFFVDFIWSRLLMILGILGSGAV